MMTGHFIEREDIINIKVWDFGLFLMIFNRAGMILGWRCGLEILEQLRRGGAPIIFDLHKIKKVYIVIFINIRFCR